jgi:hypothetical protein
VISVAVGTVFLWIIMYVIVNPISNMITSLKFKKPTNQQQNVNNLAFLRRVIMAIGAWVCTVLGILSGLYFGIFFLGISFEVDYLPGILTLVIASIGGSVIYQGNVSFGLVLILIAVLISLFYAFKVISFNPFLQKLEDVTSTLTESTEIKGVFAAATRSSWAPDAMFFLQNGILFARIQASRQKDHLKDLMKLNPKQILADNELNYMISYSDITSVKLSKGLINSKITFSTPEKKQSRIIWNKNMKRPSKEEFAEYVNLINSVLPNKT